MKFPLSITDILNGFKNEVKGFGNFAYNVATNPQTRKEIATPTSDIISRTLREKGLPSHPALDYATSPLGIGAGFAAAHIPPYLALRGLSNYMNQPESVKQAFLNGFINRASASNLSTDQIEKVLKHANMSEMVTKSLSNIPAVFRSAPKPPRPSAPAFTVAKPHGPHPESGYQRLTFPSTKSTDVADHLKKIRELKQKHLEDQKSGRRGLAIAGTAGVGALGAGAIAAHELTKNK